eukprot:12536304-Heterocapsa_arctica.AAC.1
MLYYTRFHGSPVQSTHARARTPDLAIAGAGHVRREVPRRPEGHHQKSNTILAIAMAIAIAIAMAMAMAITTTIILTITRHLQYTV